LNGTRLTIKELRPQPFLQQPHAATERGLRRATLFGRLRKILRSRKGQKIFDPY
jgi:hypothetical protein